MGDDKPIIRVAVVDDHPMVREGLRMFLQLSQYVDWVGEAGDGESAIRLADENTIDVMLMDLLMPGKYNGIDATRVIKERHDDIQIVALTSSQDDEHVRAAIAAGASGYLLKDVSPDDLLSALRQAASGRTVLEASAFRALRSEGRSAGSPLVTRPVAHTDSAGRLDPLTPREMGVLEQMARGLSNKEIAQELIITEKTVKVHVSHILGKLGVYDRTQAILAASRLGLIRLE